MTRSRTTPRRGGVSLPIVVLALLMLVALYLYQSGRLQQLMAHAAPPRAGAIQSFFTTPALVYPDGPRQRRPSPLLQALVADIDAARASVDLASFDFDVVAVADALLRASKRGVAVRLIVDSENLDTPEVSEQTGRLEAAGIAVHFDRREPFMHDKRKNRSPSGDLRLPDAIGHFPFIGM